MGKVLQQSFLHLVPAGEEFEQGLDLLCYVIVLVLGEVNFTMTACKLKFHPLNFKLVF